MMYCHNCGTADGTVETNARLNAALCRECDPDRDGEAIATGGGA